MADQTEILRYEFDPNLLEGLRPKIRKLAQLLDELDARRSIGVPPVSGVDSTGCKPAPQDSTGCKPVPHRCLLG